MKKAKLIVLICMLFFGIGKLNAQIKSTIVSGFVYSSSNKEFSITVINPNYEKIENKYTKGDNKDFQITLKQELDKLLLQGYEIIDSSIASTSDAVYKVIYVLTKKE